MTETQILQYIESEDKINQQWFIYQGTKDGTIFDFYLEHIRPNLDDRALALTINEDIYYEEAVELIDNEEYFVLTDDEADERAEQWAWELAEDAASQMPQHLEKYFNQELYVSDYLSDDRGMILDSYNGSEDSITLDNGSVFYIYRRN
jgi:hypothetical protein